jgi:hypothetical protein
MTTFKTVTARKRHVCDYCYKPIEKGESYQKQKGLYDGFYKPKHCLRCVEVIEFLHKAEGQEELHNFNDDFLDYGYMLCPECSSSVSSFENIGKDEADYKCEECWAAGKMDISLKAVKLIIMEAHDTKRR